MVQISGSIPIVIRQEPKRWKTLSLTQMPCMPQYYNGEFHSLSHCQHVLITYPVSFLAPYPSPPPPHTFSKKMHLIMQRPSCRISKVIDVIRLLTSASSHAQNFKEGIIHKWATFCSIGLVMLCGEYTCLCVLCLVSNKSTSDVTIWKNWRSRLGSKGHTCFTFLRDVIHVCVCDCNSE